MRISTVKKLMIVAVSLFGAAFFLTVLLTAFQRAGKQLYTVDPEVMGRFNVPWASLVSQAVHCVLAVVLLINVCRYREGQSTVGLVITLAVIWGAWSAVLSPVLSMVNSAVIGRMYGTSDMASYSLMTSMVNAIAGPLQSAGSILTLLSLGAFFRSNRKTASQEV